MAIESKIKFLLLVLVLQFYITVALDGRCFIFYDTKMSRTDATATCKALGGKLPELKTQAIRQTLAAKVIAEKEKTWIGATVNEQRDAFVWDSDRTEMKIPALWWEYGQPDNFGGHENCFTMNLGGLLNDADCSRKLTFYCETEPLFCMLEL